MVHRNRKENSGRNRKIALVFEYDGTEFHGLQFQPDTITIQDEIEKALKILTGEFVRVGASGRTDSGVHAIEQVADFQTSSEIPLVRLCNGLNGILTKSIAIKNAYEVKPDFSSRYDAVMREYRYLIYNNPLRSVFYKNRALWVKENLDLEYLKTVTQYLIGKNDFASFCKKKSAEEGTIREIYDISVSKTGDLITFEIKGNAFLHNMIRIIIGTVVNMSFHNLPASHIRDVIEKMDRDFAGPTASPHGLYLQKVTYSPNLSNYESAY